MKNFAIIYPLAALVCAVFFVSCAGAPSAERAAARQRSAVESDANSRNATVAMDRSAASVVHAAAPVPVPAAQDESDNVAKGKEVFEQCAICHNVDSDEEKMGPALKGLFKKAKLKNEKPATEENVRAIVKAGGNGMPGYEELLSAEEMDHLIAYLKTV